MEPQIVRKNMVVKGIGDSFYILLDKDTNKQLIIEDGVVLGCKLWNIRCKRVGCPECKNEVEVLIDEDPHDCAFCGKEFLDVDAIQIHDNPKGKDFKVSKK